MNRYIVALEPARPLLDSCLAIFLVELTRLHFAFSITVLPVLIRTAALPVLGLSSSRSDHYFFTRRLLLCNILTSLEQISQRTSKLMLVLRIEAVFLVFSSLYVGYHDVLAFIFVNEDNLLKQDDY